MAKDDAVVLEVRVSDNPLASREAAHPWLMMLLKLPDGVRPRQFELPEGHPKAVTVEVLVRAPSGPEPVPWLRVVGLHGVLATLRAEGSISLSVPESLAKDHVEATLDRACRMASKSPLFGWAHPLSDLTEDAVRRLRGAPQAEPCWISIVGARGRGEEHRLTGAGDRIFLLRNGCTVIAATEDFRLVKTRAGREKLRAKFGRIRPDVPAAEVQAMLDARPPAIKDLRKRTVTDSCALSKAPACDVADPAPALEAYRASAKAFVERCGETVEGSTATPPRARSSRSGWKRTASPWRSKRGFRASISRRRASRAAFAVCSTHEAAISSFTQRVKIVSKHSRLGSACVPRSSESPPSCYQPEIHAKSPRSCSLI